MQFRCGLVRWRLPWQRLRHARWAALGCGALWISRPAAAADPAPLSAQIEWQADACGKPSDFARRVSRRTKRVRFSPAGKQLQVVVQIEPAAGALRAQVTLASPGKPPVVRRIESPDCDDALDALALVVAISIDQRWRELRAARTPAPRRPPEPQPEPVTADPEGAASGPGELALELPAVTLGAPPPAPPPPRAPGPPLPPGVPASATPSGWTWAAGAGARLTHGVAPEALLGAELWLRTGWERGSPWSPELGLSLQHDRSQDHQRPEGQADFTLSAAALELCPLRIGARWLRLQPCALSSFGWLRAAGHDTFRAHTDTQPWGTVGAGAQALGLAGPVALRLAASVGRPLRRDRYRFEPSECVGAECDARPFHRVSAAVWSVSLGAGLSVP